MIPGMNPKQLRQAMKQLGIKQEDLDAETVIIKLRDRQIIISNPSVQRINMQGQINYQIAGQETETNLEQEPLEITKEDTETIIEQTGCTEQEALEALEKTEGDLAQAIIMITEK